MSIRENAEYGLRREETYEREAHARAFDLGARLVQHESGWVLIARDGTEEPLEVIPDERRPFFALWTAMNSRCKAALPVTPPAVVSRRAR